MRKGEKKTMGYSNPKADYSKRFVNPYNFVPMGKKCKRWSPETNGSNGYTGYFECSIKLLTPLFIPNTSSTVRLLRKNELVEKEDRIGYDFFSYDDWSGNNPCEGGFPPPPDSPVIPGSEIRGVIRSVHEAAFNGCMSSVDLNRELSRRCSEVKNPGILYWDKKLKEWRLKSCTKGRLRVEQRKSEKKDRFESVMLSADAYARCKEGQEIWVKIGRMNVVKYYKMSRGPKEKKSDAYKKGYLHKGEYINGKKYESVFIEPSKTNSIKVRNEDVELLERVLREYQDRSKNQKTKDETWYPEYKISRERTLVYYSEMQNGHVCMCPACIGREAFVKTIGSLLEKNGGYQPCSGVKLCPTCQMFGMMEKEERPNTHAYGSKVRITDAVLGNPLKDSSSLFYDPIVLPELGEPRPSAVEFYTKSPYQRDECLEGGKKGYWTYDYKCEIKNGELGKKRMQLDENQPLIRGRKFYWHSERKLEEFKDNQVSAMRQRIRPMKPTDMTNSQSVFRFRVYFEQLNKRQLQQLKWALDFDNPECAHKIGRAKPLGFGSVQITVTGLQIREINENTGAWKIASIGESEDVKFKNFFEDSEFNRRDIPKELLIMVNWKNRPKYVSYPLGAGKKAQGRENENDEASHQWFKLNKEEKGLRDNFSKVLPKVEEDANANLGSKKALYRLKEKISVE